MMILALIVYLTIGAIIAEYYRMVGYGWVVMQFTWPVRLTLDDGYLRGWRRGRLTEPEIGMRVIEALGDEVADSPLYQGYRDGVYYGL